MAAALAHFFQNQQVGIVIFLCVIIGVALLNILTLKSLGSVASLQNGSLVSILVPARDEALNIEGCLRSLLNQNYQPFEVIVLDDESMDGTPNILKRLGAENQRLKVLNGQPLPAGWVGKNWACHQLSQAASGDYLLFVDADTRHQPGMLGSALARIQAAQADWLSGLPRQEMATWGERLVLPVLSWAVLSFFPVQIYTRLPFSFLTIAVGQFLLFRREAYLLIGGHAAVRGSIIEDMALARLAKKNRLNLEFVDLKRMVCCRMYHNFKQVQGGLSKNLFSMFGKNLLLYVFVWSWLAIVFLMPATVLILSIAGALPAGFSVDLALAAVLLSLISWLLSGWYFKGEAVLALVYPITILLTVLIACRSAWFHLTHRTLYWKGRDLSPSRKDIET